MVIFQGRGYAKQMLDFVEGFAPIQEVGVVSCETHLIDMYQSRGYSIVRTEAIDGNVPNISRKDLEYIIMIRNNIITNHK